MKGNIEGEKVSAIVTSPEPSTESDFSISGNYFLSMIVRKNECTVSFPISSANTLFSFTLKDFVVQEDCGESGWFGYETSSTKTHIVVPPDRPGFYVEKDGILVPRTANARSRIFWDMNHTVDSIKVKWSGYPVLYSHVGSSYPAIAFIDYAGGIFTGIGDTPDRAVLNAIHLSRVGSSELERECSQLISTLPRSVHADVVRNNSMMNLFFSNSRCIDSEDNCIMASKSPKYYVSTGFWARDFVFWSLPGIERISPQRAKELLSVFIRKYSKNKGTHALYIDGRILYDGFELDELAAYLLAISKAVKYEILDKDTAWNLAEDALGELERWKSESINLYSTELNSSDDPVGRTYVTYDNVILWHSLEQVSMSLGGTSGRRSSDLARSIRMDIMNHMIEPERKIFCYSTDLKGDFRIYDDPTGSLLLLPFLGFIDRSDETFTNTVRWIKSDLNEFMIKGNHAGCGNTHVGHPWIHYYSSLLMLGDPDGEEVLRLPNYAKLACETIDETTGQCLTGIHFPGSAGFLSEAVLLYEKMKSMT